MMTAAPKALYAIPDCEAVREACPAGFRRHLSLSEAADRIRAKAGLVPVAIDPAGGRVFWADFGRCRLRESKHLFSLKALAEGGRLGETFTCDIEILDDATLFADGLSPCGLIFHSSRCGSTVATKALARVEGNVVISQGGPLQRGFWAHATDDWRRRIAADECTLTRLRSLVMAMTRPRLGDERRAFVKFISWNVLYIDLIACAFPNTPILFLYRDPAEIIATIRTETTAALHARGTRQSMLLTGLPADMTAQMDDVSYLATCYARYFDHVFMSGSDVALVNYRDMGRESFAHVLSDGLDYAASETELATMLAQFDFDSKDDGRIPRKYSPDQEAPLSVLTAAERAQIERLCGAPARRLDASPRNLFAQERAAEACARQEASA